MKKVLVIVAHPDDETIWMGGLLIRNRNKWHTTIISLCRKKDKDRAPRFKKACKILNAKCFISDLEDEKLKPLPLYEVEKVIIQFIEGEYDYIFTHGGNGEYGHIRHKEVHRVIKKMIKEGKLNSKKVFFFSYKKKEDNFQKFSIYNSNADKLIKLNHDETSLKKNIITKVYGFQRNSFEEKSAKKIEAFDELKNESFSFISLSG